MMQAVIAVAALLVGILLGFLVRANSAKFEKALLEKQLSDNAEGLAASQRQLAQASNLWLQSAKESSLNCARGATDFAGK
jgi:uncharacterized membrane-anchored protein YhcB (DUF1043 family)